MQVKILGKKWKVRYVPHDHALLNGENDEDSWSATGTCRSNECHIAVASDIDRQVQADTLWHEITHAVDETLGLGLTEQQVHALAAGQMAVLFDNPKLIELLLGRK
jgi:hypothetical protein